MLSTTPSARTDARRTAGYPEANPTWIRLATQNFVSPFVAIGCGFLVYGLYLGWRKARTERREARLSLTSR